VTERRTPGKLAAVIPMDLLSPEPLTLDEPLCLAREAYQQYCITQ
jgi:hypothetical protein